MAITTQRRRAGWWVAGLTAVVTVAAVLLLFRPLRPSPPPERPAATPSVVIDRGDGLMREQATLFDPTPLFLPTEWNTNQRALPAGVQHQPGQVFKPFPPSLRFGEAELSLPIGRTLEVPKSPKDLLMEPSHDPFLGFDREDRTFPPLTARAGFVEIRNAGTGEVVLSRDLEGSPALSSRPRDGPPAEFLIAITVSGLLGGPSEAAGSEAEEADAFLRDYLAKSLHLGERLPPGIYRVVVGP
jgi:hypothetical protein